MWNKVFQYEWISSLHYQSIINRSLFEFVKSVLEIQQMVKINSFRDAIAYQMMFSSGICQLLNWSFMVIWSGIRIGNVKNGRRRRPRKNSVYYPTPPLKPFKFGSKHLFSCSGIALGLCAGLVLFQKNHLFCLLFHFIFRTPPHPPPHLRTGNLKIPYLGSKFSSAALRAAKTSFYEWFRHTYG